MAICVLFSHAAGIGKLGDGWAVIYNRTSLAQLALYGFFAISGFLLAGSAMKGHWLSYLWRRCLRIFPGLITCLIVTAFGFGVLAWYHYPHTGCTFNCYVNGKNSPVGYVLKNALLDNPYLNQHKIAGTPRTLFHT